MPVPRATDDDDDPGRTWSGSFCRCQRRRGNIADTHADAGNFQLPTTSAVSGFHRAGSDTRRGFGVPAADENTTLRACSMRRRFGSFALRVPTAQ
ncbi:hypothetical protein HPB50_001823 [Hyalomma asiaticum]|uniref:Uncharacterized protein n=1 Tax=Hyalomma asiaticum TaxID=266040 RepID=A0ACB7SLG8_HYAAI|nr:hypothetical protein HPB50_001823 [Hyalomma asiaticum]